MNAVVDERVELRLSRMNRQLSELLDMREVPLTRGGGQTMSDTLWVWGVLGGKEVGKSTLINALAGGDVVRPDDPGGEGTFRPACYHVETDADKLSARLDGLDGMIIDRVGGAPASMSGLVLVDLPDFDSLFLDHAEQVRRVASRLDGIIWVTTPKKVGDARAIQEVERVLKARTNFVYVVNKMDWLLAQSDRSAAEELERVGAALALQRSLSGANGDVQRSFMISAKHRTADAIRAEIERNGAAELGGLDAAIERLVGDMSRLRSALTTPPSADDVRANKLANLTYQTRHQAQVLLSHYKPESLVAALDQDVSREKVEAVVHESLGAGYVAEMGRRLQDRRRLVSEWTATLFRRRIAGWPLLGLIAWPAAGLAGALSGLRSVWLRERGNEVADAFRVDGVALEDRVSRVRTAIETRLARISDRLNVSLPGVNVLTHQFRGDASVWADARREAVFGPLLRRRPTLVGRAVRWLLPPVVLLWFPIVQPLLAALLGRPATEIAFDMDMAQSVVAALSGANVLTGLTVSLLIMAALVGAIYSRAVRDAHRAADRMDMPISGDDASVLAAGVVEGLTSPVVHVRDELAGVVDELNGMAGRRGGED